MKVGVLGMYSGSGTSSSTGGGGGAYLVQVVGNNSTQLTKITCSPSLSIYKYGIYINKKLLTINKSLYIYIYI
jgi:hypothetical protein